MLDCNLIVGVISRIIKIVSASGAGARWACRSTWRTTQQHQNSCMHLSILSFKDKITENSLISYWNKRLRLLVLILCIKKYPRTHQSLIIRSVRRDNVRAYTANLKPCSKDSTDETTHSVLFKCHDNFRQSSPSESVISDVRQLVKKKKKRTSLIF